MALTPQLQTSQAYVYSLTGDETGATKLSQAFVQVAFNYPTPELKTSQTYVSTLTGGASPRLDVSQQQITVLCRGRVDDPKIRAWTYTLDGHDFYILRLGQQETLVYDLHSGQWFTWGSHDTDIWRAFNGINWIGAGVLSNEYGSNVVVGDDGNGALYFLNPDQYQDDDALEGTTVPRNFLREIQGQAVARTYAHTKIFAIELLGSIGQMDVGDLTAVTLSSSRDRGTTYVDHGTIIINNNDLDRRVDWRSLGSYTAPGILFKISDYGALQRIDNLTIHDSTIEAE